MNPKLIVLTLALASATASFHSVQARPRSAHQRTAGAHRISAKEGQAKYKNGLTGRQERAAMAMVNALNAAIKGRPLKTRLKVINSLYVLPNGNLKTAIQTARDAFDMYEVFLAREQDPTFLPGDEQVKSNVTSAYATQAILNTKYASDLLYGVPTNKPPTLGQIQLKLSGVSQKDFDSYRRATGQSK